MNTGVNFGKECFLTCHGCQRKYELSRANKKAELRKEQEVKCPYCGHIVGYR